MTTFNVRAIDVWGNAKDGWDLNASYRTDINVDLDDNLSDVETIKAIRKACGHRADARGYYLLVNDDTVIDVRSKKDGKPCYLLEVDV